MLSLATSGCIFFGGASAEEIKASTLSSVDSGEISSYMFDMTVTAITNTDNDGISMSVDSVVRGNGVIDLNNHQMMMDMDMTSSGTLAMEMNLGVYLMDNIVYMKSTVSDKTQWMKMDLSSLESDSETYNHLGSQLDLLEQGDVELLDDETINGVECHVLQVTPDIQTLYDTLLNQQSMGSMSSSSIPLPYDVSEMMKSFSMKCWIAKDTEYMMKMYASISMDMSVESVSSTLDMEMTIEFSNYNLPVYISLPPGALEATDYTKYLSNQLTTEDISV